MDSFLCAPNAIKKAAGPLVGGGGGGDLHPLHSPPRSVPVT